ncbi:hypothetical protein PG997_002643 [Apiospora hydei]|uniref:F-box domain-containing protein n=1 Tax=Apiospora hydei TaxID=1337664 RepID=A0ABR1WWY7_9PEZI
MTLAASRNSPTTSSSTATTTPQDNSKQQQQPHPQQEHKQLSDDGAQRPEPADMAPSLLSLPLELLLHVSSYLDTPECGSLRLSCKQVENALYLTFARDNFTKRQHMLTESSLQALLDISKSRLAPFVKTLFIGTDLYSSDGLKHITHLHAHPNLHRGSAGAVRRSKFVAQSSSQEALLNSGYDMELLTAALGNLTLDLIGVCDSYYSVRFPGNPVLSPSYGATAIYCDTCIPSRHKSGIEHAHFSSKCANKLLFAAARAKIAPKRLQFRFSQDGLIDFAFNIPKFLEKDVARLLSGLEELKLDLYGNIAVDTTRRAILHEDDPSEEIYTYHLRRFLALTPNIRHLRLNSPVSDDHHDHFLEWLATAPPTSPPQYTCTLTVTDDELLAIVTKFKRTLKNLSLQKVLLVDDTDEVYNRQNPPPNKWASFLEKLCRSGVRLDSIYIKGAEQQNTGVIVATVSFTSNKLNVAKHQGPDTMKAVRKFADDAELHFVLPLAEEGEEHPAFFDEEDDDEDFLDYDGDEGMEFYGLDPFDEFDDEMDDLFLAGHLTMGGPYDHLMP